MESLPPAVASAHEAIMSLSMLPPAALAKNLILPDVEELANCVSPLTAKVSACLAYVVLRAD
jgi:hypothetical protein